MKFKTSANSYSGEIIFPSKTIYKIVLILTPFLIFLASFIGLNYYDLMWWIRWCKIVERNGVHGILNIYNLCESPDCKVPYPPLAVLIFVSTCSTSLLIPEPFKFSIFKLVLVILPGLVVYKFLAKIRDEYVALLWLLFIPFLQVLFALQFDVLLACLIFLSVYMILRNRIGISAALLGLATAVKHVTIFLLPAYIAAVKFRKTRYIDILKFLFIYIAVSGSITLPFFISAPRKLLEHILLFHSSRAPQDISLWAIPSIILHNNVFFIRHHFVNNLWFFFFSMCYIALFVMFCYNIKKHRVENLDRVLPIYISTLLTLYIAMNKIGNLNYMVWPIPTALIALKNSHIKTFYKLTALIGIIGALTYAFILYIPPASVNKPIFIVEDLTYWNARALIAQSLNYYLFYIATLIRCTLNYRTSIITSTVLPMQTPVEFVQVNIFKIFYAYRLPIIITSIISSQIILTILIITQIKWLKKYLST